MSEKHHLLALLRHARAEPEQSPESDRERPLSLYGMTSARKLSHWLKANNLYFDRALVSAAQRTRETADLALDGSFVAERMDLPELYHTDMPGLWRALSTHGAERTLVVGHNPTMHQACTWLAKRPHAWENHLALSLPPGGFALFSLSQPISGTPLPASAELLMFTTVDQLENS